MKTGDLLVQAMHAVSHDHTYMQRTNTTTVMPVEKPPVAQPVTVMQTQLPGTTGMLTTKTYSGLTYIYNPTGKRFYITYLVGF